MAFLTNTYPTDYTYVFRDRMVIFNIVVIVNLSYSGNTVFLNIVRFHYLRLLVYDMVLCMV